MVSSTHETFLTTKIFQATVCKYAETIKWFELVRIDNHTYTNRYLQITSKDKMRTLKVGVMQIKSPW